jgi:hypothetical protein
MVSYSPAHFFPVTVYTTKALSAGRSFKTFEEAISGYKNKNIAEMIGTAAQVVA